MQIIQKFSFSFLVWIKKGESFPGTLIPQKQGYHILWTGSNACDFRNSKYLGVVLPCQDYLAQYNV